MKPIFAKVLENLDGTIYQTRKIIRPYFSTEFHFHRECQMTYIVESEGRRIIGDSLDTFESDELTFIGSDLPHVWHNDKTLTVQEHTASSLALFFDPDRLVEICECLFNTVTLNEFLIKSRQGLLFYGETKNQLKAILRKMVDANELQKTIYLFEMLEILIHTQEYKILSGSGYVNTYMSKDNNVIDKIFRHVFDNYRNDIMLDEVAEMANLTKTAFCRYFKARTQKTFIQFVNEVRISQACKLISLGRDQITNIAYTCGFNSMSNFNKIFKSIKGVTPSIYKAELRGNPSTANYLA